MINATRKRTLKELSIAVVDQNLDFLAWIGSILRSFNVGHIIESTDADATLRAVRAREVDILVAERTTAGTGGFDLVRQIRGDPDLPSAGLPIIGVAGHGERGSIEDAIRAGADDCLVKPVRPVDVFRRLVRQITDLRVRVRAPNYFGPDRRVGLAGSHKSELRSAAPQFVEPRQIQRR